MFLFFCVGNRSLALFSLTSKSGSTRYGCIHVLQEIREVFRRADVLSSLSLILDSRCKYTKLLVNTDSYYYLDLSCSKEASALDGARIFQAGTKLGSLLHGPRSKSRERFYFYFIAVRGFFTHSGQLSANVGILSLFLGARFTRHCETCLECLNNS